MEEGIQNKLDRRKTMTMNWEGLGVFEEDDDRFFETHDRFSAAAQSDLCSSSDEEEDFDESRISFSSAASSLSSVSKLYGTSVMSPDYDIWMAAPGSISERRRRLLHGLGFASSKSLLRAVSIQRVVSSKGTMENVAVSETDQQQESRPKRAPLVPVLLVRSRSDSDIEMLSFERRRKDEFLGKISKQRITRTSSIIASPCAKTCPHQTPAVATPAERRNGSTTLTSILSSGRFGSFFLIKNLDTGKEFIVNEYDEDGMWNRFSDLQTGKQLTMEEFEKCVGYSPVVKELMRRANVDRIQDDFAVDFRKFNSYVSKSLRMSKRRGVSLLRNIMGVAHSMSLRVTEKDKGHQCITSLNSPRAAEHKQSKNNNSSNQWVKVRQTGKSYKEFSALHLCQEIQAHQGSIWTLKFSVDARHLASAGEDKVIHVWEVQGCEIMMSEGGLTPLHPLVSDSTEKQPLGELAEFPSERKQRGKSFSGRKGNQIPYYVHVPETVFALSEKPICSFKGHLDDVLDLSWSSSQLLLSSSMDKTVRLWDMETKSCLKFFAHNDYVTCIQFNPTDENYFISGSLDAKVRIWNIPERHVVDWSDVHEMVTAVCYTPDGQGAMIGSHKGICRKYSTEDCILSQTKHIEVRNKKKSHARKITGFQFSPVNPYEVLVSSADSRIRIWDGSKFSQKIKGFRNINSQISASYSPDGKYVVSASEDSHVYLWRREEHHSKKAMTVTQSHEQFHCKDVSVAIPWHGTIRGDPPPVQIHSKRHSKRITSHLNPSVNSPKKKENSASAANSKRTDSLPPLPRKSSSQRDCAVSNPEHEPTHLIASDLRLGESFHSNSTSSTSSSRFSDSPSINNSSRPLSWSWFDNGSHGAQTIQPTAWGIVIVTATLGGEIRAYQNFGLPRRVGRQSTLF